MQLSSLELEHRHLNTDWDLPQFQDLQSRKVNLAIAHKDNLDPQSTSRSRGSWYTKNYIQTSEKTKSTKILYAFFFKLWIPNFISNAFTWLCI